MVDEFIRPNWHVILVHYPLGLLTIGIVIELFAFLWRRSSARVAGRWMILLGAVSAFPTAALGIYAYRQAISHSMDVRWRQLVQNSALSADQWEFLNDHMLWNVAGTVVMATVVVAWLGSSDRWRRKLHWPLLAAAVIGLGCYVVGSWHGGEAVYRYGTGVEGPPRTTDPSELRRIERFVPPMQLHMLMVGATIGVALVGLGLSIRRIAQPRLVAITPGPALDERAPVATEAGALGPGVAAAAGPPDGETPVEMRHVRQGLASGIWLLAAGLALGTALAGAWVLDVWNLRELWKSYLLTHPRLMAHSAFGVSIVVLLLALAGVSFWGRRPKWATVVLASLLLLVVAAQVYVGVTLMYDSDEGGVVRWVE